MGPPRLPGLEGLSIPTSGLFSHLWSLFPLAPVTRPPDPLPWPGCPLPGQLCALSSPIKCHPVSVPSVLPLSASPPLGLGEAYGLISGTRPGCHVAAAAWPPAPLSALPHGPGTAMYGQLLPVLVLLVLGALGPWGQESGPGGPLEEPPEQVPEEDGILVLSQHTLGLALREHPTLLVEFCECMGPEGLGGPTGATQGFQSPTLGMWDPMPVRGLPQWALSPHCAPGVLGEAQGQGDPRPPSGRFSVKDQTALKPCKFSCHFFCDLLHM